MLATTSPKTSASSGPVYLKEPSTRSRANTSSPRPRPKSAQQDSPQLQPSTSNPSADPSKPQTTESGTQYTPPDWPPTSSRSSLHVLQHTLEQTNIAPTNPPAGSQPTQTTNPSTDTQNVAVAIPKDPPPEPPLRVTPQISLQNAHTAVRRQHNAISETPPESPSSKRSKSQNPDAKVLPRDYWLCDAKILAAIIADMLMELIRYNDDIPLANGQLTRFHSRAPPGISVHDYLARLTYHATLSPPILLSMVYYIDKLCALYSAFTINSLTVHRFLITAATVASKGLSDSFWTNNTYARVGGVSLKELFMLEMELLERTDWKIVPSPEALLDYYKNLVGRSSMYVIDDDEEMDREEEHDSSGQTSRSSGVMDTASANRDSSMSDETG